LKKIASVAIAGKAIFFKPELREKEDKLKREKPNAKSGCKATLPDLKSVFT
jgi:hypothetical protein